MPFGRRVRSFSNRLASLGERAAAAKKSRRGWTAPRTLLSGQGKPPRVIVVKGPPMTVGLALPYTLSQQRSGSWQMKCLRFDTTLETFRGEKEDRIS
jgi:hypothetical protein